MSARAAVPRAAALVLGAAALAALPGGRLTAQSVRELSTSRQYRGEPRLGVRLEYAAGRLLVVPGPAGSLYRMQLTYDESRYAPVDRFDSRQGLVHLGAQALGRGGLPASTRSPELQAATVQLSPRADLALDVRLGAAEATLDLGGLRLAALTLESGASRARVRFAQANPIRCTAASFVAGGAELVVEGLGRARCGVVTLDGGIGRVVLDFGGSWSGDLRLEGEMALGGLVLRIPRGTGVRLALDRLLTSFRPEGLARAAGGTTWTSERWEDADRRLDIEIESALGNLQVEWID